MATDKKPQRLSRFVLPEALDTAEGNKHNGVYADVKFTNGEAVMTAKEADVAEPVLTRFYECTREELTPEQVEQVENGTYFDQE